MDLGAFVHISDLDALAKANNIEVPRLRGYRLMKDEEPIDYRTTIKHVELQACEYLISKSWEPKCNCCVYSSATEAECELLIANYDRHWDCYAPDYDGPEVYVRRELLNEDQLKMLDEQVAKDIKAHKKQYDTWNKYCGRGDVLYIHARIGGANWKPYDGPKLRKEPWFLAKVDSCDDNTYCDIYAKISVFPEVTEEETV